MTIQNAVTFKHLTAGSTVIMPDGEVLRFMGQPGHVGLLQTDRKDVINMLRKMASMPGVQIEEVVVVSSVPVVEQVTVMSKPQPPEVQAAATFAAENSERVVNPMVAAARENLAKQIAANSAKDGTVVGAPAPVPGQLGSGINQLGRVSAIPAEPMRDLSKPGTVHNPQNQ